MPKCLVIGGGIVGLSVAYELVRDGWSVQVLDQARPRRTASWAAAGILPPAPSRPGNDALAQLHALSQSRYATWCDRLTHESGVDVGFRRCGGLYLSRRPGDSAALRAAESQWRTDGIEVQELTADELARREPALNVDSQLRDAYLLPSEAQVRPPRLLQALRKCLVARGVQLGDPGPTIGWVSTGSTVTAVTTEQGRWQADAFCVAAGPWSAELLRGLGVSLAVEPRRGQMVAWQLVQPMFRHIINEGPRYLLSRDDGWLLAGSTVEDAGFDDAPTEEGIAQLLSFARQWAIALRNRAPQQTWAGLRPWSRDGSPHLGQLSPWHNVVVATGHFRAGIDLAPATARLVAELLGDKVPRIDLTSFSPARN